MSVFLSIVSTALHLLNAAGFILLSPGTALADYISASVLYGTAMWLAVWVLPTVWEYELHALGLLRGAQTVVVVAGIITLLATHTNIIGIIFSVLLIVEVVAFLPYMLLYEVRGSVLIRADFARAVMNSVGLIVTIFIWHGDPSAYAAALLASLSFVTAALHLFHIHRAPLPRFRILDALYGHALRAALHSRSLRQLLGARAIEVAATLSLNAMGMLGSMLALKAGSVAVQATAFNARRLTLVQSLGLGTALYIGGMTIILAGNAMLPTAWPHSLRLIGWADTALAAVPFLCILVLTVYSIRPKSHAPSTESSDLET